MHNNHTRYKGIKYVLSFLMILFIGVFSGIAQTNMTKIKDGTMSGTSATPNPGVILELESANKGFLTPRLTTQQRDAIAAANRTDGLLIYNKTTGCFNYWSDIQDTWLSLCGTPPPAVFEITSLQCEALTVNGTFTQGQYLTSSNYLTVPVTVTQAGTYEVVATTTNGYYFTAKGTFPSSGNYTLILEGLGTPNAGYNAGEDGDLLTFSLNNKASSCDDKHVFVTKASVSYEIDCNGATIEGEYMIGKTLDSTNKLILVVDVQSTGYWSVSSNTINGYSFRGSGTFTQTGPGQTIELLGTGTPIASGINSFNLTSNSDSSNRTNCMGIEVTVKAINYSVDCSNAIVAGTYKQDEAMTASNTVTIKANILATGETSIRTNTVGGIYFTSGPLSFDTLGEREVVLTAVGTPTNAGVQTYTLDATTGMVATCSFDVSITGQPVAYTLNCSSIVVEGVYAPNSVMTSANKMIISVNVQYTGDYTIATNTVNGVTFSASGVFDITGTQEVTLVATGTGEAGGSHRYTLTTNSALGATTCNKNIEFVYRKMNILGLGGGTYQPASATNVQTSKAVLQSQNNFGPNGTVKVDGVNLVDGAYNQANVLKNLINTNKIDIIVIGYNYNPNAASILILEDFVKNKKGVLIHSQETGATGVKNLINAIENSPDTSVSGTGTTSTNSILSIDDPLLNGPFGDIRGKNTGADVNNSYFVGGYASAFTSLVPHATDETRSWLIKHGTLGYVYIGDSGWTAGNATNADLVTWPASMTAAGAPKTKAYAGGVTVYNSILYANTMAWAIQYVQENIDVNYQVE